MEFFFFLPITEIIIVIYCFGSGLFLNNLIIGSNRGIKNYSEICIFGFLLTLIFAQIINFISPLKEIYFWFFLIFSIINIYKNKFLLRKFFLWLRKIAIIFFILLPFKIVLKGHDDIYYHLPKLNFINNHKIIFGIGNYYESFAFTNGWSHIGSFFNFFFGSEKNLYLVSFVFFILIISTLYFYFKNTDNNNIKVFSLVSIIFLCSKFYRLQEFGNDFQSILLIFLVFNLYFSYTKTEINNDILIKKILLYSTFATLFKIHGVLINLFLILFLFEAKNIFKKKYIKIYLFILISYFSTFSTSFINSGCVLYPFKSTCFSLDKVSWSAKENINNTYLQAYNKSYEQKYLTETSNKMSYKEWLTDFNWFKFHFTSQNFYKPFLKSIFILFLIFLFLIKFVNFKIEKIQKKNFIFLLISIFILLIWTIKIPLMRASGYGYIVCTLIFLFSSFINVTYLKNLKKLNQILIVLIITPLILLNSLRIYKEINKYNTNDVFYFLKDYGKYGKKSVYKNLKLIEGNQSTRGKNFKIEIKSEYFILKNSKSF